MSFHHSLLSSPIHCRFEDVISSLPPLVTHSLPFWEWHPSASKTTSSWMQFCWFHCRSCSTMTRQRGDAESAATAIPKHSLSLSLSLSCCMNMNGILTQEEVSWRIKPIEGHLDRASGGSIGQSNGQISGDNMLSANQPMRCLGISGYSLSTNQRFAEKG